MPKAPSAARARSLALRARLQEGALVEKASRLSALRARIDSLLSQKQALRGRLSRNGEGLIVELGRYLADVTRAIHEEEAKIDSVLVDLYAQEKREEAAMMTAFGDFKTAEAVHDKERQALKTEEARREAMQIEDLLLMQRGGDVVRR